MSVTFIGAGPGPGLITLRGLEALRQADVILYFFPFPFDISFPQLLANTPHETL